APLVLDNQHLPTTSPDSRKGRTPIEDEGLGLPIQCPEHRAFGRAGAQKDCGEVSCHHSAKPVSALEFFRSDPLKTGARPYCFCVQRPALVRTVGAQLLENRIPQFTVGTRFLPCEPCCRSGYCVNAAIKRVPSAIRQLGQLRNDTLHCCMQIHEDL